MFLESWSKISTVVPGINAVRFYRYKYIKNILNPNSSTSNNTAYEE